jgi:hypothetical protein
VPVSLMKTNRGLTYLCDDCGLDTTPCKRHRRDWGRAEWYTVHDRVWKRADMLPSGHLCIGCLEQRLGRRLQPGDFPSNLPISRPHYRDTPRLLARKLGIRDED